MYAKTTSSYFKGLNFLLNEQPNRYDKEMRAMEAVEDATADAQEREWVGLTDDEITELFCDYDGSQFPAFVRAIEAKLKEKNYD
jgi:hypothetical protein